MKTNNNIPAYRFKGYTDAWELRKLGEISTHRSGTAIENHFSEDGKYKVISIGSYGLDNKYIDQKIRAVENEVTRSKVVNKNELTMVLNDKTANGNIIGRCLLIEADDEFVINQRTEIISFNSVIYPKFAYVVLNGAFREQVKKIVQGGTQIYVNYSSVEQLYLSLPTLAEQEAIGTFFSTLDQHITLHQRKLDTLKEQKKTYLKLLFPAKGQTKPALRFQGFEDDWEEVKLGELCDIRTGKLDANAMVENGKYDFYTSGIKKYKIDVAEFEGPAITIAGNGATVGYMHLADGKFNAYQRTYVLTNFKVDRSYIFSEVAEKLPMKIQQEARTGNIPYIVLSMLTELSISLPSLPEQEAIGTFFRTLDQEIAQVEDKLASLKEMKKTLLRKLFV